MTTIQQDNFADVADTLLEAHAPDVGAGWLKIFNEAQIGSAGGVVLPSSGSHFSPYYTQVDSPSDDQRVTMDVSYGAAADSTGAAALYAMLRARTDDASRYEGIASIVGSGTLQFLIKKALGGSETLIAGADSIAVAPPFTGTMVFEAVGDQLTLKWDGVTILTVTDSDISGAGNRRLGLRRDNVTPVVEASQPIITSFLGEDLSSGGGGVATSIAASAGDAQTAEAGTELPIDLEVLVLDDLGAPLAGVDVDWAVGSGGGSITPATSTTDGAGHASATATLGATEGAQTFTATATGLTGSPVTFDATATAAGSGVNPLARVRSLSGVNPYS